MFVFLRRTAILLASLQGLLLVLLPCAALAVQTAPPSPGAIKIDNRLTGTADTVTVTGLTPGDTVRVYADEAGAALLGSAAAASASAVVSVAQLGVEAGFVYVTVTSPASSESRRIVKSFSAEPISHAPAAGAVTVVNEPAGTADKVTVKGLHAGDTVKVYRARTDTTALAAASVPSSGTAELPVDQLGGTAGYIYVTVTEAGKRESPKMQKAYDGEALTVPPAAGSIHIVNRLNGTNDSVTVTGLLAGDVVKVYADEAAASPLGSAAVAAGQSSAEVTVAQLSPSSGTGRVYVTLTRSPRLESRRVAKLFSEEPVSPPLLPAQITVLNYRVGMSDEVIVAGIEPGDTLRVYADESGSSVQASAVAAPGETSVVLRAAVLSGTGGFIYVSVQNAGKAESGRVRKGLPDQEPTPAPDPSDIAVQNNGGLIDLVAVKRLAPGDVVRVYADEAASAALGNAVVAYGSTEAAVSLSQVGAQDGLIYVTVTRAPNAESRRVAKSFAAVRQTSPPQAANIRIGNEIGTSSDTITVKGLTAGDTVKVYANSYISGEMASGIVLSGNGSVTLAVSQLDQAGGTVYITAVSPGKTESRRTVKAYAAEGASIAPDRSFIRVDNVAGSSDTIAVSGLAAGDTVKVYAAEAASIPLATAVVAEGSTQAAANVSQLGSGYGVVYVSVTSPGRTESGRVPKIYAAEPVAATLSALQMTVLNAAGGSPDEVTVYGLQSGDTVRLYNSETDAVVMVNLRGESAAATAIAGQSSLTFDALQLSPGGGALYVTVQSSGKLESGRAMKAYPAE
ncbi:hypothetical protein [Paenibacillus thalictri]|uniref:Uncharacterized protein n=1 Tax=Paenibacillus thalictri TaxID=2527873 RepID=A0A4Q9DXM0_9BACL|nr:hypothetical protein [Paenibacillus thalictri]TBL80603.1 hypothetical protein EYB31_05075 [Paenibacillus thalictri]